MQMCKLKKGVAILEFNFLSEVLIYMSPKSHGHSKKGLEIWNHLMENIKA